MANAFGVRVNPHVWGTGVAMAASLQLIATLPDNPPGLNPIPPLLEFDQSEPSVVNRHPTGTLRDSDLSL